MLLILCHGFILFVFVMRVLRKLWLRLLRRRSGRICCGDLRGLLVSRIAPLISQRDVDEGWHDRKSDVAAVDAVVPVAVAVVVVSLFFPRFPPHLLKLDPLVPVHATLNLIQPFLLFHSTAGALELCMCQPVTIAVVDASFGVAIALLNLAAVPAAVRDPPVLVGADLIARLLRSGAADQTDERVAYPAGPLPPGLAAVDTRLGGVGALVLEDAVAHGRSVLLLIIVFSVVLVIEVVLKSSLFVI